MGGSSLFPKFTLRNILSPFHGIKEVLKGPSIPAPPAPIPIEKLPTEVDPAVIAARNRQRSINARARGRAATILTDPQGLPSALSSGKTILGT